MLLSLPASASSLVLYVLSSPSSSISPCRSKGFSALLDRLPIDPAVWESLRSRFDVRLGFGLFQGAWNRGFDLSSQVLRRVAERAFRRYPKPQGRNTSPHSDTQRRIAGVHRVHGCEHGDSDRRLWPLAGAAQSLTVAANSAVSWLWREEV
jgi:hypothetical protein